MENCETKTKIVKFLTLVNLAPGDYCLLEDPLFTSHSDFVRLGTYFLAPLNMSIMELVSSLTLFGWYV